MSGELRHLCAAGHRAGRSGGSGVTSRTGGHRENPSLAALLSGVDQAKVDAVDALCTEAVYDAARRARLMLDGALPVPEPSERAWDIFRKTRAGSHS